MFELAFFLVKYKLSLEILDTILKDPKVEIVENRLDDIAFLVRNSRLVKYYDDVGDLLILSISKRLGIELKTLDKDLVKLSKSL